MARPDTTLELRRAAASSRGTTPATSPRRQPGGTPRKLAGRGPSATPGGGAGGSSGTPATVARTPSVRAKSSLALAPRSERAGRASALRGGMQSEPASPRSPHGSVSGSCRLEELLPPGLPDDAAAASGSAGNVAADNIKVFVRVRPLNARERSSAGGAAGGGGRSCLSISQDQRVVVLSDSARQGVDPLAVTFDHVFPPEAGQEEVYAAVGAQMVDNCMAGFNSSMFVYGQTGSGKTHTITGDVSRAEEGALAEQCGLTLRVFRHLFERITAEERDGVRYTVKCYYAEIYNEDITDLLAPAASGGGSGSGLQIRDGDPHRGVYVEDLSEHVAVNADDVMRLIQKGSANRHTSSTRMNERSSRSHSVFTAVVEAHEEQGDSGVTNVRFAKLNLIDLAGSERVGKSGATGDQLTEAKSINKSLSTLGRVVTALTERQQHVPYRDSKLTFLLKESLGGNSKTTIVACVSPSEDSAQETHSTLVFAAGAKKIRNKAVVNQDTVGDVKALKLENERLKRELAKKEDVRAAELRLELEAAQERAAAAEARAAAVEARAAAAEERQQQLEVALNDNHASLQQRHAELALVKKEAEESKTTCQLLQKDREQLIDSNATLSERVEQLQATLERRNVALQQVQQDAAALQERYDTSVAMQRTAEDEARSLQHDKERLTADVASLSTELEQAHAALEEGERSRKALKREVEQLLSDLRRRQRELADVQGRAAAQEDRLRQEIAVLNEAAASRTAQLHELESKLAAETVCTAKYRRMVGEIGKLIDWAQSTSPLPPTLGGRTSPAGFPSGMLPFSKSPFGGARNGALSPLGDATNLRTSLGGGPAPTSAYRQPPLSASPGKRPPLQIGSPAGHSPMTSPSKMR